MTTNNFLRMMRAAEAILLDAPETPGYVDIEMHGYDIDDEEHTNIEIHFGDRIVYEIRMDEKKEAQNGESV